MDGDGRPTLIVQQRPTMTEYERPTLIPAGSFKKLTGLGCSGPRDELFNKQCL